MESPESKKLYEIEMLMSMYPREFYMDDLCSFLDLKEFVENGNSESAPFGRRLRYTIKLDSLKKVLTTFGIWFKWVTIDLLLSGCS